MVPRDRFVLSHAIRAVEQSQVKKDAECVGTRRGGC